MAAAMVTGTALYVPAVSEFAGTSITVSAAETYGDFEYTVSDDNTVTVTKYNGTNAKVTVPEKINSSAWQGFDVDKDIIWFSEGVTSTGTYLTGYGFDGNVVSHRTKVLSSDVCPEWDKFGVCDDAKKQYENEGVRVWKGDLYLGMFTKRQDTGYRSNVMRFKRKIFY